MAYEEELIYLEQTFWQDNVLRRNPPPYVEDGDLVLESVRMYSEPADPEAEAVTLDLTQMAMLAQFLQMQQEKSRLDAESKKLETAMKRLRGRIASEMGACCRAVGKYNGVDYTVTYNPVRKQIVAKDNLTRLQLNHPEIYDEYVTTCEYRKFNVRSKASEAA